MKYLLLFTITIQLLLVSCQKEHTVEEKVIKGIPNYFNQAKPSSPKTDIKLEHLFTIENHDTDSSFVLNSPRYLVVDNNDNIYIADRDAADVKKFDKNGTFIKTIAAPGKGPGELFMPISITVFQDTLFVISQDPYKIAKYSLDGDFIEDYPVETTYIKMKATDSTFIYHTFTSVRKGNRESSMSTIRTRSHILSENKAEELSFYEKFIPFTTNKEFIFSADNPEKYSFNVYNSKGKQLHTINKSARNIPFSKQELKLFNFFGSKIKPMIRRLLADNNGYIWVFPSIDRSKGDTSCYIDLFKDKQFLNRVVLDIDAPFNLNLFGVQIHLFGNKLYIVDLQNQRIKVFGFEYINSDNACLETR